MKKIIIFITILVLASCAQNVQKIPQASDGSKADGIIKMSYFYGVYEIPVVDWDKANHEAKVRCIRWGFNDATTFGRGIEKCQGFNGYGTCIYWEVISQYQCID